MPVGVEAFAQARQVDAEAGGRIDHAGRVGWIDCAGIGADQRRIELHAARGFRLRNPCWRGGGLDCVDRVKRLRPFGFPETRVPVVAGVENEGLLGG